jgi:hypothetical protein
VSSLRAVAVGVALTAAAFVSSSTAEAGEEQVTDVHPPLTAIWGALQLIPSPQWLVSERGVDFGLRWQVTPLLYSFALHRKLWPLRILIAEPVTRHGGSVELFFSPEYLAVGRDFERRWGARAGVRSYFPLAHRGEYLSVSLGSSYLRFQGESSAGVEAGAYVLYGLVGVQVTWSPTLVGGSTLATLRVRVF